MVHQIDADGVVFIERESDFQLCADAIDTGNQNWIAHSGKVCPKQTAESASFSENLRPVSLSNERLDTPFEFVAKIDIDPSARVSLLHFRLQIADCKFFLASSQSAIGNLKSAIISNPRTASGAALGRRAPWNGL